MGPDVSVYFNPSCSKCRTAQGILAERGVEATYVEYLTTKPDRAELERLLEMLGTKDPRTIVRKGEPLYKELELDGASRDELLDAIAENPILLERPIVVRGNRAVVARPAERVLELLDD